MSESTPLGRFVPPVWEGPIRKLIEDQAAFYARIARDEDAHGNPRYLTTRHPRPPEWLKARDDYAARWNALRQEGYENGWLEHEHCYECEGADTVTTDTETVERRLNPDWQAEPFPTGATVTIPRAKR